MIINIYNNASTSTINAYTYITVQHQTLTHILTALYLITLCSVEEEVQCWARYNPLTSDHSRSLSQTVEVIDLTGYMSLLGTKQAPITFNTMHDAFQNVCCHKQKAAQLLILHYWLTSELITTHTVKVLPERRECEMNKVPMCW